MANKLSFDIGLNTQGYVAGAQEASKSTQQLENSTKEYLKSFGSLKKQFGDARRSAESLAVQYRLLSKAEKESEMGKQMAADMDFAIRKAAELKDVITDTNQAIQRSSSDTQGLDALKDAMEIGKDLATAYAGAVAKLTGNEKAYKDMIATIAMIQGGFNAAIKITNALQKQSNIMIGIGNLQLKAKAIAEELATKKTIAATAAQKAFNAVAKANPYVLLATVIIAAATAIGAYMVATRKSVDEEKKQQQQLEINKKAADAYKSSLTGMILPYKKLQTEWNKLKTIAEKTQWIKDNKSEFEKLHLVINNIKDAERIFVTNTSAMIQSFMLRAKAAAYAARAEENYKKLLELDDKKKDVQQKYDKKRANLRPIVGTSLAAQEAQLAKEETMEIVAIDKERAALEKEIENDIKKQVNGLSSVNSIVDSINGKEEKKTKENTKEVSPDVKLADNVGKQIIKDLKDKVKEVNKEAANGISNMKTDLKLDFNTMVNIDAEHIKAQIETALSDSSTGIFDEAFDVDKLDFSYLSENLQKEADKGMKSLDEISEAMGKAGKAKAEYAKSGNLEGVAAMDEEISKLTDEFNAQAESLQKLAEKNEQTKNMVETFDKLGNYVGQVGSAFSMLGEAVGSKGLQAFGIIAETIANIMLSFSQALIQAAELGPWAWIAFGIQGIAQVAAMVAQIKNLAAGSYAEGGVIPGSSWNGDKLFARVNSGERVLTAKQNKRLEEIANSVSGAGIFNERSVVVHGIVRGKDLMLVQKNYNSIASRAGQEITF